MPNFRSKNSSIGKSRKKSPQALHSNFSVRDTLNKKEAIEKTPVKALPTSLEGKKEFFNAWVKEHKIPGKVQAWFVNDINPDFFDWRILNEDDGSHRLLKIESPQKGIQTPSIVQTIHEQLRKEHLKAFRASLSQIWFRPTGDGRYGLLVQANLHGINSARGYKSFLDFLERSHFKDIVCCHQIECRPAMYFNPVHPPHSVLVEIREGFGQKFIPLANSNKEYHILERLPRNKAVIENLPEKIKDVIHPNKNDSFMEFHAGAGFIGISLASVFSRIVLLEAHAYANTAAIDNYHKQMLRNVTVLRNALDPKFIESFFAKSENAGTWTVFLHPQDGAPLPAGSVTALAAAKPGRILLLSESLDHAATEIKKFRNDGYMLRKVIPLDLEPGVDSIFTLFYFVPDRAGVLGNPALKAIKSNPVRPRERTFNANKKDKAPFEADSPRFVQRKRNNSH